MQMAYADLLYFITDATVDLLTNTGSWPEARQGRKRATPTFLYVLARYLSCFEQFSSRGH
jgi:hypothetical protein